MFIGYIKNSEDKAEQLREHKEIQDFAQKAGLDLSCVYSDSSFANIKEVILPTCQGLIICSISSLGASLSEIKENLFFCRQKDFDIFSIEDGYKLNSEILTPDFFKGIDLAINIRSDLISQNTKKILQRRKNEGVKLGRPLGSRVKERLEGKETEIRRLLSQKVSKAEIARRFNVTRVTVFNFIKKRGLENEELAHA